MSVTTISRKRMPLTGEKKPVINTSLEHKEYDGRAVRATQLGLTGRAWVKHAWADWYYIHVEGTWANGNAAVGVVCREQAHTVKQYLI